MSFFSSSKPPAPPPPPPADTSAAREEARQRAAQAEMASAKMRGRNVTQVAGRKIAMDQRRAKNYGVSDGDGVNQGAASRMGLLASSSV